jgi:hypothetical protein
MRAMGANGLRADRALGRDLADAQMCQYSAPLGRTNTAGGWTRARGPWRGSDRRPARTRLADDPSKHGRIGETLE